MTANGNAPDLVRDSIRQLFEALISDVGRAQSVLRDAMPTILKSFQSLSAQVREQVAVIEGLSLQLRSGEGGFISTMRGIVDTFVRDLVMISQQSMKIVDRVTLMGRDVDSVIVNVDEIEEMARTTRFIALNAHIEAHRSEAGSTFRVVADEVKRLAGDAQEFSGQIRVAVDRARERLTETRELVAKLASHDMNHALSAQSGLLNTVEKVNEANAQLVVTLRSLEASVETATRALQFDDILMQLLSSIGDRIGLLQSVWLESLGGDPDKLARAFERHRGGLEKKQPVTQSNLDAGTVELF
ncbi:MAG: methyl-accepting chemotaxis protein [Myxococcota bacterium]